MKITDALRAEHRILRTQLDSLEQLLGAGATLAGLRGGAAQLAAPLLVHAHIEDELLFPALESHIGAGSGPLAVMHAEHEEIERGLTAIDALQGVEDLQETLAHVLDVARQHFIKEDEVLFPMAEALLDGDVLEKLSEELSRRRSDQPFDPA